ncbi:winged helix-turn-helix transcriptional regulator [Candidatus Shapirobacteria bacterium]|nr:winged helix-turn-helix transcriptional regulator [Candidatus Shapirobacteria bacterium]
MDKIYKSMADKNRRTILRMLKEGDRNVNQILQNLEIGQATLSSHLAVLRKAGLVSCRVLGKQRIYKLEISTLDVLLKDIEYFLGAEHEIVFSEIILRRKMT